MLSFHQAFPPSPVLWEGTTAVDGACHLMALAGVHHAVIALGAVVPAPQTDKDMFVIIEVLDVCHCKCVPVSSGSRTKDWRSEALTCLSLLGYLFSCPS